jgi:apolipoprotein N-acyltransferase
VSIAPVICYESVYGEYVSEYVRKGANLICVITNDGWWGNTPGYRQHFDYARLRAIETRRYIARSANTGISGFIDDKGNVMQQSEWWVPAALRETVLLNSVITFYVKYGDYIGKIAVVLFFLKLLSAVRAGKRVDSD